MALYFRGELYNGIEQLYIGIEDNESNIALVVHPNSDAVLATEWQKWHIDLGEVRTSGVDVSTVTNMYIGVDNCNNQLPGGAGKIYIDDIQVTKPLKTK